MGVYIKGMEMPRDCDECPMRQINLARCQLTQRSTSHYSNSKPIHGKPKFCPLVEVLTPHGRLVDASEAYDKIAEQEGGYYMDMDGVDMGLQDTPTVIEAEDEE